MYRTTPSSPTGMSKYLIFTFLLFLHVVELFDLIFSNARLPLGRRGIGRRRHAHSKRTEIAMKGLTARVFYDMEMGATCLGHDMDN